MSRTFGMSYSKTGSWKFLASICKYGRIPHLLLSRERKREREREREKMNYIIFQKIISDFDEMNIAKRKSLDMLMLKVNSLRERYRTLLVMLFTI